MPEPATRPDDGEVDERIVVDREVVGARPGGAVGEPQRELDEAVGGRLQVGGEHDGAPARPVPVVTRRPRGRSATVGDNSAAVTAVVTPTRAPAPSPRAVRGRRRHTAAAPTAPAAATAAPTRTAHTHPGVGGGAGTEIGMRAMSGLATSTISHAPGRSICNVPVDGAPGPGPGASVTSLVATPHPSGPP